MHSRFLNQDLDDKRYFKFAYYDLRLLCANL